jgi:hypothetical protein
MAAHRTYYEILNVAPGAELVVIEAAYRALMKKYHPDQGGGAANAPSAAEINRAYAVLRDRERRADYDHKEWVRQRDIQLAASQAAPLPRRRSNAFGWAGWLVSLVLAGTIGLVAMDGNAPALHRAELARNAALATPELRSQPLVGGRPVVSPAEEAELRAAASASRLHDEDLGVPAASPPPETSRVPAPAPDPAPAPVAAAAPPVIDHAPARRPVHARRTIPHHGGTAVAQRHDKDFLERQGYIY